MCPDSLRESYPPQPVDDSDWEALLAQEESIASPPPPLGANVISAPTKEKNGRTTSSIPRDLDPAPIDPWAIAQSAFKSDEVLELEVAGVNKGGLLIRWHGLQGFVPASQLIDFPHFHIKAERERALRGWLNKTIKLKIIELIPNNNRLILSERASQVKVEQRESIFNQICPGDQVEGHVTNLTRFGAFVDLGGVEGLIHISELSWSRVTHPSDIVQPGQPVTVLVLKVDHDYRRIALSLKRLRPDPWRGVEKRYHPGQLVQGVVNNIADFGAFVQVEEELEGLIHISELDEGPFFHPSDVVHKGQEVVTRILAVDGPSKRLALSLRKNDDAPGGR